MKLMSIQNRRVAGPPPWPLSVRLPALAHAEDLDPESWGQTERSRAEARVAGPDNGRISSQYNAIIGETVHTSTIP